MPARPTRIGDLPFSRPLEINLIPTAGITKTSQRKPVLGKRLSAVGVENLPKNVF
jgi:hypothetical protein